MLKGSKVRLRAITPDDLPRFVVWVNDSDVKRHLGIVVPFNLDDERDWYERQRKDDSTLTFALDTEAGQHIGSISLMRINRRNQSAEIGIMIGDKSAWEQGYCTEALGLLIDYAFNLQNLNRLYLRVDVDNLGALTCYERNGFVVEGEMREVVFRDGQYRNQYLMSLLRNECWQTQA